MTTDNKRDPADVLVKYEAWLYHNEGAGPADVHAFDLASALCATLAELETYKLKHRLANEGWGEAVAELGVKTERLRLAEAVIEAADKSLYASMSKPVHDAIAAYDAYEKEPRDGHE